MDFVNTAATIGQKLNEVYNDYSTGKAVRLGQYKGVDNVKRIGHYNKKGRKLGIYHQ